jgi:hypothetical protein
MTRSNFGAMLSILLLFSCGREPVSPVFQPALHAGDLVARQRYGGDMIVFVSDESPVCRRVRNHLFGARAVGEFIAMNFAAVEVPAGTDVAREVLTRYHAPDGRPQIIIASPRLDNLRIHVMRLDRVDERSFLEQLRAIKKAKTIDDFQSARRAGSSSAASR